MISGAEFDAKAQGGVARLTMLEYYSLDLI